MKLFRRSLSLRRNRQRPLPAWATEKTDETAIVRREAEALIAESRSRTWASASTGLLKVIRTGLLHLDDPNNPHAESPSWIIVSGQRVTIADSVMVDLGTLTHGTIEDIDPEHRLPLVRIGSGPHSGQLIRLTPGQIVRRSI